MGNLYKNLGLTIALLALAYGFWASPQFKEIAAGVAIFLFGMLSLEQGFKIFNGGLFETLLRKATQGLGRSIGFGIITTTVMQSSSLVSVLTISFLSAGLISLSAGIGVIFGANLGTTTGAWLIAGLGLKVNIAAYAMPMLVFGVIFMFQKTRALQGTGYILAGVGFLFLGIHYMKEGFETFKAAIDLASFAMDGFRGLMTYTAIGIVATVIMQSSHATLVLTITALAAGQVTYENALALAIGSNMGTTISAILGAISAKVEGRRLAGAHVIFNTITGLVAIALIQQMMGIVDSMSTWLGIRSDDYTLKLAIFHSLFNILGLLIMVPFTARLVDLLHKLFPEHISKFDRPAHLSDSALQLPETAVEAMRQETSRLYNHAVGIIAHGIALKRKQLLSDEDAVRLVHNCRRPFPENIEQKYEESVKGIYSAIVEFSYQAQTGGHADVAERIHDIRNAGRDILEAIKAAKHLQKNLLLYMRSSNRELREQYDIIRLQIVSVLRAIEQLKNQPEDDVTALSLDEVKVNIEKNDLFTDAALGALIRERKLAARVATSLMKDADYSKELCSKLLNAAIVLFGPTDIAAQKAERSVAFDEQDIRRAATNQL